MILAVSLQLASPFFSSWYFEASRSQSWSFLVVSKFRRRFWPICWSNYCDSTLSDNSLWRAIFFYIKTKFVPQKLAKWRVFPPPTSVISISSFIGSPWWKFNLLDFRQVIFPIENHSINIKKHRKNKLQPNNKTNLKRISECFYLTTCKFQVSRKYFDLESCLHFEHVWIAWHSSINQVNKIIPL